jgi:GNAT superfamily N-acetyltransferase
MRITIASASTDEEILATRDVMRELRAHIAPDDYVPMVRRMMQTNGYQLAALSADGVVCAVAGYRFMEMLYCGRVLYVDDLSTGERYRSRGYGKLLLDWLRAEAKSHGCHELHLDSGVQREAAHRFYFREGLTINCYHFRVAL